MKRAILIALALLMASATSAAAKRQWLSYDNDGRTTQASGQRSIAKRGNVDRVQQPARVAHHRARTDGAAQVVGRRPEGCPARYCGCATARKLFGRDRPELHLAANWLRTFPRASPAPGLPAARPGHVLVLIAHIDGDRWKVWDANSGGGLTRIHVRSIRGFEVVNPPAAQMASLP